LFTYLTRFPGLWLGRILRITPRLKHGLDYIPIGVFAAMVIPSLAGGVASAGSINWPFALAAAITAVIALWTKHPLWTMLTGVVSIALFRLL
jgi:branched chain amino acid efflux pump